MQVEESWSSSSNSFEHEINSNDGLPILSSNEFMKNIKDLEMNLKKNVNENIAEGERLRLEISDLKRRLKEEDNDMENLNGNNPSTLVLVNWLFILI